MKTALEKANIDYIGKWPVDPEKARQNKGLIQITPEDHLHLIHGDEQHILISLIVSNEYMHLGLITIPTGGYAEVEEHDGEEALSVLQGTLVVRIFEPGEEMDINKTSQISYTVYCGEKLFIPKGVIHSYKNFGNDVVKAYFAIAPKL